MNYAVVERGSEGVVWELELEMGEPAFIAISLGYGDLAPENGFVHFFSNRQVSSCS